MQHLKSELVKAYMKDDNFLKQSNWEQWLATSDKNTKYFYNCVKDRKIKNRVLMLKDDKGRENFSEGSKGSIAVEYFQDLF